MPLVDELGNSCLLQVGLGDDPRVPAGGFTGGSFETWLSRLADEQPYLRVQENLENQALFEQFSVAIADVLGDAVQQALAAGSPQWLSELIRVAHQRRATLITFNYDPLIECAIGTGLLFDWGQRFPVFWAETTGDVPNWPPGPAMLAADPADTFRLLKLHGSLNWYWAPRDASGVSIARRDLPGVFGAPEPYTEEKRRRVLPGRVPFVVPPAAVKSPYYRNPIIREIWQQAADSLRQADRVFVVGYSLPPTDLTFAGMLADSLRESRATLMVVDLRASAVADRLTSLGFPDDRVEVFEPGAGLPIPAFSGRWRDETSVKVLDYLRDVEPETLEDPMMVVWGEQAFAAVIEVTEADGLVTLHTEAISTSFQAAARPRDNYSLPLVLPVLQDVIRQSKPHTPLVISAPDGSEQAVVGWVVARTNLGYGKGVWNAFIPSASVNS
jgi:hypothetical protein